MKISLSKIKPSPKQIRKSWDEDKMQELADSIKARGVIVPPKIRPISGSSAYGPGTTISEAESLERNSKYELVYGHRRLEAARRAGLKEIECIVEGVDDKTALAQSWIENRVREDMTAYDIADALVEIAKQEGVNSAIALSKLGYGGEGTIERYWTLQDQPEEVRKIFGHPGGGQKPQAQIVEAVTEGGLAETKTPSRNPKARVRVLTSDGIAVVKKAAEEGLSAPQVRKVAEAVKAAPTPERKKHLLETPYSSLLHDADIVREMPPRPIKEIYQERKERHELTPAVASMLKRIKRWTDEDLKDMRDALDAGKFAPEWRRPFASKLRAAAKQINALADRMEK